MRHAPRVLIIDDHPLFRDALDAALQAAFPNGALSHHAGSFLDAINRLETQAYDLVLLDLTLSDVTDFDGLSRLKASYADMPVVIVSATETRDAFLKAQTLGAAGYLPKSMTLEDLSAALVTVLDGGTWFPEALRANDQSEIAARVASLTPAQRKVVTGLSDGLLNKQIAFEMNISIATVKAHLTAIFRKLGASNRTQALLIYQDAISLSQDAND